MLSHCPTACTARAFRIAYSVSGHDKKTKGFSKLPDKHTLKTTQIPRALEYILWEVPKGKRLYRLEKSDTAVKMVYTGFERLPGRVVHGSLSWTNESVFDHIIQSPLGRGALEA